MAEQHAAGVETSIEDITPQLAHEYLATMPGNRHLRPRRVDMYAADMARGQWVMTGEAIKFDERGGLRDGQHRLRAVISSGATVRMMVVRGLPESAFDAMDAVLPRSASDVLAIRGATHATTQAAAARLTLIYRRTGSPVSGSYSPSRRETLTFIQDNPGLEAACKWLYSNKSYARYLLPPSVAGWLLFEFSLRDPELACDFFADVFDMSRILEPGSPSQILRKKLLENRLSNARLPSEVQAANTVQAWNALNDGKGIKILKWTMRQEFPPIRPELDELLPAPGDEDED